MDVRGIKRVTGPDYNTFVKGIERHGEVLRAFKLVNENRKCSHYCRVQPIHVKENTHYKRVPQDSSFTWQCNMCSKEWIKQDFKKLIVHIRVTHLKTPKYKCTHCDQNFTRLTTMRKHKLEEHNIDERYQCNACDKSYFTQYELTKHKNTFHMLGQKYQCEACDFETYNSGKLIVHKEKHKLVKDQHCAYCKKSFLRRRTLLLHEKIHTGERSKVCKVCGQAFVQKASLNYHMTKYHPGVNF